MAGKNNDVYAAKQILIKSKGSSKQAFNTIALNGFGNIFLPHNNTNSRMGPSIIDCKNEQVTAGNFVLCFAEHGLIFGSPGKPELLGKAIIRHGALFPFALRGRK